MTTLLAAALLVATPASAADSTETHFDCLCTHLLYSPTLVALADEARAEGVSAGDTVTVVDLPVGSEEEADAMARSLLGAASGASSSTLMQATEAMQETQMIVDLASCDGEQQLEVSMWWDRDEELWDAEVRLVDGDADAVAGLVFSGDADGYELLVVVPGDGR